ncbi:hypothetical protein GR925_27525 [Streptomyces sp. HUCO-GS316]|nr:hypothetical protein [Streptomyces sp. HUCO-GS316]
MRDRNGATVAQAEALTFVKWSRLLDDTSTANIIVNPTGDCCEAMGNVRSWRQNLEIYRDGTFMWGGPITRVNWSLGQVEIFAADVLAWLDRRVPHDTMTFTNTDLSVIALALIEDGFRPDDPGHTVEVLERARVFGSREYEKDTGQTGDHLRDLAEAGIDYTAVGSKILILPETFCSSVGRLSDADFPEGLVVSEEGGALTTRWVVAGDEDSDAIGSYGGADDYYGLLERYEEQTSITDSVSATEAARARVRTTNQAPVFIDTQQVTISPLAAVDIALLVPGWCLDITTDQTCRTVSQRLKIVGLTVEEDAGSDDSPGTEQIAVQVAATGAEVT